MLPISTLVLESGQHPQNFCFFWCPSHSALTHKVQQESYHHESINRKSYLKLEKFTETDLDFIYNDFQRQLFPPQLGMA